MEGAAATHPCAVRRTGVTVVISRIVRRERLPGPRRPRPGL